MKIRFLVLGLIVSVFFMACSDSDDNGGIGGSTDLETNEIGYNYDMTANLDGISIGGNIDATVTDKSGKVIDVRIKGNLGSQIGGLVSSGIIDGDGDFDLMGSFINSSDGIAYVNANGEQNVLVKYDSKVGDTWSYTSRGGKTVNSKVIAKSTEDDFMWGGMLIKIVEVEQTLPYPGLNKAIFFGNHKFGLVGMQVVLEDGSIMRVRVL